MYVNIYNISLSKIITNVSVVEQRCSAVQEPASNLCCCPCRSAAEVPALLTDASFDMHADQQTSTATRQPATEVLQVIKSSNTSVYRCGKTLVSPWVPRVCENRCVVGRTHCPANRVCRPCPVLPNSSPVCIQRLLPAGSSSSSSNSSSGRRRAVCSFNCRKGFVKAAGNTCRAAGAPSSPPAASPPLQPPHQ
jgi:hypothetical protein